MNVVEVLTRATNRYVAEATVAALREASGGAFAVTDEGTLCKLEQPSRPGGTVAAPSHDLVWMQPAGATGRFNDTQPVTEWMDPTHWPDLLKDALPLFRLVPVGGQT